jgi:hydrogenase nickel incorporation protein HypA/HybF
MHEYSIVLALLERVEKEAATQAASRVHSIHLRLGEYSGVETSLLRTAFEMARDGSICASAKLQINPVEATWVCSSCGLPIERGSLLACPECRHPARLASGDEIWLDRIEMEVP